MMRVAWYGALLALALVTAGANLDRETRRNPAAARLVPAPLRAYAHGPLALIAVQQKDQASALAHARALVRARPVPSENLSLFAQVAFQAGQGADGYGALTVAGQRGWRDPVAQIALALSALEQRQYAVAAQRIDALWAVRGRTAEVDGLTTRLLTVPAGRAAFAQRLATAPRWQETFLYTAIAASDPAAFADTLVRAEGLGARIDCRNLGQVAARFSRKQRPDLAAQVLPQRCAGTRRASRR